MRLADLEPAFIRNHQGEDGRRYIPTVASLAEAQGVRFLCPTCFAANGGPRGTHQIICWSRSRGVPDDATPGPGRWTLEGTGIEDLTLGAEPGAPRSVQLNGGCGAHFYVTAGQVTAC